VRWSRLAALGTLYRSSSARLGKIYSLAARADFIAAVAAMLGVLIFDTLPGLVIGIPPYGAEAVRSARAGLLVTGEQPARRNDG
jgi:hypothetical protein